MPVEGPRSVTGALILLGQMSEYPADVLEVLAPAERSAVLAELDTLTERAAAVDSSADLFGLADAVHRLVEDREPLRALLLPAGADVAQEQAQRTVTLADQEATDEFGSYVAELTPQIRNAVTQCRAQLRAALGMSGTLGT
jgi:hypothetical protein